MVNTDVMLQRYVFMKLTYNQASPTSIRVCHKLYLQLSLGMSSFIPQALEQGC